MKESPFKTSFSSLVKAIVSEEKDKYLAMASLEEVRAFIPNIDKKNIDLLPVAFNACVINRVNKNDDIINTETALAIYKNFIYKQINVEHNRHNVIGVILTAGFSEFGTDKSLTEEQVKGSNKPFNITLGGIVWKVVNSDLASMIEDSNDSSSPYYMGISASWELGFSDYKIAMMDGGYKNIENAEIIKDTEEINKLRNKLKANGGDGKTIDDKYIYRMVDTDVVPLGIGFTQRPAADVEGIAVNLLQKSNTDASEKTEPNTKDKKDIENVNNEQNKISQATNCNVNIERKEIMKITSIKDITDESLKQTNASAIAEFISSELSKKSIEWEQEKNSLSDKLAKAQSDHTKLTEDYSKVLKSVETLQATVDSLTKEKTDREKVEKFNSRMTEVNEVYELDEEVLAAIVEEVKIIASDEDFNKWKKKASVLLKGFAKKSDKTCEKCEKVHSGECEAKASTENDQNKVIDDAVDKAEKEKGKITNSSTASDKSLKEKYQQAFAKDQFVVKF